MKTILIIIPYSKLFPPMNGGMLRCFHLLRQLSRKFKVTAITHQPMSEFQAAYEKYPELVNCRFLSTSGVAEPKDIFSILPQKIAIPLRFRFWKKTLQGPADSNFLLYYPLLKKLLKSHKYDFIFLENLSSLHAVPVIRKLGRKTPIIYDAHNVDSKLLQHFPDVEASSIKATVRLESSLSSMVDYIITCSKKDLADFKTLNKNKLEGIVVPNGVELKAKNNNGISQAKDQLIFVGSLDYAPNREGLLSFCTEVLPFILKHRPSVRLMVVGTGDPGPELQNVLKAPGIELVGKVENVEDYYRLATLAIVPLASGSGTRLKVLEAMGNKVPVVPTSKGAEGIEYSAGNNICIADEMEDFGKAVLKLLDDTQQASTLAIEGYHLVKRVYDWNVIGDRLNQFLTSLQPVNN